MRIIERARTALTLPSAFRTHLLVQSSGTIFSQLIPIAISPLLTRLFAPVDFGLYGTVVSVSALLAIIVTLRVDHGIMVAPSDEEAKKTAILSLVLAVAGTVVFAGGAAVTLAATGMLDRDQITVWGCLIPLAGLLGAAMRTLTLHNNRLKRFPLVSKARILQAISTGAASLLLGYSGVLGYGLIVALLVGNLTCVLLLAGVLWPLVGVDRRTSFSLLRDNGKFIRFSLPADLVNTLSSRLPFIIFPALFGFEQTGYLALAYRVVATPARFAGTAIGEVFYSHAAREYEQAGSCWRLVRTVALLLAALGVAGFSALFVLADPLFALVFGAEWRPAADFTQILTPMLLIGFVVSPLSAVFYIAARQREDLMWQIAFLAATGCACFVGLWKGDAAGSLVAFSLAGSVLYLVYFALIRRYATGPRQEFA